MTQNKNERIFTSGIFLILAIFGMLFFAQNTLADGAPQLTISATGFSGSDCNTLTKECDWTWSSTDTNAEFRYSIDTKIDGVPTGNYWHRFDPRHDSGKVSYSCRNGGSNNGWGSVTSAKINRGTGTFYLHVQARDPDNLDAVTLLTGSAMLDNTPPKIAKHSDILVDATGVAATGTTIVTDGVVTGVTITNGGSGYTAAPSVVIARGTVAKGFCKDRPTGTATISNGVVTGVTITNGGSGCTNTNGATVTFSPPFTKVLFDNPTATDNSNTTTYPLQTMTCASSSRSNSLTSGSFFPVGRTEIICTVKDYVGNTGRSHFKITVRNLTDPNILIHFLAPTDTTNPNLVLNATGANGEQVTYSVSATDYRGNPLDSDDTISCTPGSLTASPNTFQNTFNISDGVVPIICDVIVSHKTIFEDTVGTVEVVDSTLPVITLVPDGDGAILVGDTYVDNGSYATIVSVDGHITLNIDYSKIDNTTPGRYPVTYTAVNPSDPTKITTVTRYVVVSSGVHNACNAQKQCVSIAGAGADQCQINSDCGTVGGSYIAFGPSYGTGGGGGSSGGSGNNGNNGNNNGSQGGQGGQIQQLLNTLRGIILQLIAMGQGGSIPPAALSLLNGAGGSGGTGGGGTGGTSGAGGGGGGGSGTIFLFLHNINPGATDPDVIQLQIFLNTHGFVVATSGPGSLGNEISYFGPKTVAALKKFQEANAKDILAPNHLTQGTGRLGTSTRKFINSLLGK